MLLLAPLAGLDIVKFARLPDTVLHPVTVIQNTYSVSVVLHCAVFIQAGL